MAYKIPKTKVKVIRSLDINMFGKSYIQLDTNKGTILIQNEKEGKEFLKNPDKFVKNYKKKYPKGQ
jgi:hypothetical protein